MKHFLLSLCILCFPVLMHAQKGESIIKSDKPITWLGMDFTQVRYIGSATQYKDAGEITADQLREKYFPGWNDLFVNEQKKYDVAKYVNRSSVEYATTVTEKANAAAKGKFFSENPSDYQLLTEDKVAKLVKGYNFQGAKGIGLMFFIEGMSKGKEEASAWVVFVDTGSKTVVAAKRITGSAGGFGFRNYWAKSFFNILKDIRSQF